VPFGSLKQNRDKFIEDEYWSTHVVIGDPHNMRKEEIQKFLHHVRERQRIHGPHNAFRFQAYQRQKKFHTSLYPTTDSQEPQEASDDDMIGVAIPESAETPVEAVQEWCLKPATFAEPPATNPETQPLAIDPALIGLGGRDMVMVNEATMASLRSTGLVGVLPINGPNEGQPLYAVPADALTLLNSEH
jgi:hypothetical protein